MILLSDFPWGDFPTWVQALTGGIALFLSFMTYFQSKKIKELVDISNELGKHSLIHAEQTKELKRQASIMADQLNAYMIVTIPERMPLFSFFRVGNLHSTSVALQLLNNGLNASRIKFQNSTESGYEIHFEKTECQKGELLNIHIKSESNIVRIKSFSFQIIFLSPFSTTFTQEIILNVHSGTCHVEPPVIVQ